MKPDLKSVGVPITVGNPAAASSLAIDQRHMEEFVTSSSAESLRRRVRKAAEGHFFTVRAESTPSGSIAASIFMLEIQDRDPYLVAESIAKLKQEEEDTIRPVLIVRYVTMTGDEGLWALKLNPPDGKANPWNTSALNILELRRGPVGADRVAQGSLPTPGVEEDVRGDAAEVHRPHCSRNSSTSRSRIAIDHHSRSRDLGRAWRTVASK